MSIDANITTFSLAFLGGLVATLVMTLIEIPVWKKFGLRGVLEWHENQVLSEKLFRLDRSSLHVKGIFFLHFANGGLGGIGFVLVLMIFPLAASNVISGISYGVFLWIVTLIPIHRPITGITPWKHPDGIIPVLTSLIGHLVYGSIIWVFFTIL